MVFSSSGIMAERFYSDKYLFFKKQAMFAVLGTGVMIFCARMKRQFFYNLTYLWVFLVVLLLVLCQVLGASIGGRCPQRANTCKRAPGIRSCSSRASPSMMTSAVPRTTIQCSAR